MTDWFTVEGATPEAAAAAQERLVGAWADAPTENLEVCEMILETARIQVIAFAPAPGTVDAALAAVLERFGLGHRLVDVLAVLELADPDAAPPRRYVYAQLQQATNLWNAGRVSSDGNLGDGGFIFTPRPLDKTVKQIIRPTDGKPHVL